MTDELPLTVGKREIARLLGVAEGTPAQWVRRPSTRMPDPDHPDTNGQDTWRTETIIVWAKQTGRWKEDR